MIFESIKAYHIRNNSCLNFRPLAFSNLLKWIPNIKNNELNNNSNIKLNIEKDSNDITNRLNVLKIKK